MNPCNSTASYSVASVVGTVTAVVTVAGGEASFDSSHVVASESLFSVAEGSGFAASDGLPDVGVPDPSLKNVSDVVLLYV